MNKERLIGRWNWFQRIMTYPDPSWDKETRMDFYFRFMEFVDTVESCGYRFVRHAEKRGDKYLLVATDLIQNDNEEDVNDY